MDDLRVRFGRLDRLDVPDLWNEAVTRAAEHDTARRPAPSRLVLLIAVALLLAALAGAIAIGAWLNREPAPDQPAAQFDNGLIVGQRECQLIAIDPASNEARELLPSLPECAVGEHPAAHTAWSADGRYLAYVVARMCVACFTDFPQEVLDEAGAWIYDATTDAMRQLAPCPERYCEEVDISPDGSLVAFTARSGSGPERHALIVSAVEPGGPSRRIELPGWPGRPRFSPDGTRIVTPVAEGPPGLYAVDVAAILEAEPSHDLELDLLHEAAGVANPAWSPDGDWIAFEAVASDEVGIWLIRADGTDARAVAIDKAQPPSGPAWSPDGTQIAYVRAFSRSGSTPGRLQLWTVGVAGGDPTLVYESECCLRDWKPPTWSPDGEYIAFSFAIEASANSGLALIRPDGSDLRFISDHLEPDWQPVPLESPAG